MSSPILPVSNVTIPELSSAPARKGGGFSDVMSTAIGEVENSGRAANDGIGSFLRGEGGELHTVALAAQRAEITFDLFLQTRNKIVQAYQEIMRMPM